MIRLEELLKVICGEFVCVTDGQRKAFSSKDKLICNDLYKNYVITSIRSEDSMIVLELQSWETHAADTTAEWVEKYREQNKSDPSFELHPIC